MATGMPVKVVLKSTTTQTLSDRFTEMLHKSPGRRGEGRPLPREEMASLAKASAKNRRLAEQMSRRSAAMDMRDDSNQLLDHSRSVKSRLDISKIRSSVKDRLGSVGLGYRAGVSGPSRNGGFNRGGVSRGRGAANRGRGRARANYTSQQLGSSVGRGGGYSRGYRVRMRGRGRGRGQASGGVGSLAKSRDQLDTELDTYMKPNPDSWE